MSDLFIFAGEASGDLHGEKLLKALYEKNPDLKVFGVGGPKMRALGMKCIMHMEEFQVMGFVDVFLALPKLMKHFYQIRDTILKTNPKAALFIDYPGFNLRMEKHLKKKGYKGKLIHYICPTVWAWGKKRIFQMEKTLDLLLTIFPFEVECFSKTSLQVKYVGHPLIKRLEGYSYEKLELPNQTIIGIFPGSRRHEIEKNFDRQLNVVKRLLQERSDLFFPISLSHEKLRPLIEEKIAKHGLQEKTLLVPVEKNYDLMKACDLAIAKSGTVTLELALHHVPTVVTYAITNLDLFILVTILNILLPFYCIVNIASKELVFPELIGPNFTEDRLYLHLKEWLDNPDKKGECKKKCEKLRSILQDKDASQEASEHVLSQIN